MDSSLLATRVRVRNGGHTLNLHQFAADGVTLLGHPRGAAGETIAIAPDLHKTLVQIDRVEGELQQMIDGYVAANGLEAPEEALPLRCEGFARPILERLDLESAGIRTVIWATGFSHHYDFVKPPVLDGDGFPIQTRGVTEEAGLYFVGMPWMPSLKSGTLVGVSEAAEHVAGHLTELSARQDAMALARA